MIIISEVYGVSNPIADHTGFMEVSMCMSMGIIGCRDGLSVTYIVNLKVRVKVMLNHHLRTTKDEPVHEKT